jgi:hypothetical protein
MKRTILELDAIGLAAMKKLDRILIDQRHVLQIQNWLLRKCLGGDQFLKLLDIFCCFDPAAEDE